MNKNIINEAIELLSQTGLIANESEFSELWLGHSECYLRTLRHKKTEPSIGALAICASRLQKAGERMLSTQRYRQTGQNLIALSSKFQTFVNADIVEFDLID